MKYVSASFIALQVPFGCSLCYNQTQVHYLKRRLGKMSTLREYYNQDVDDVVKTILQDYDKKRDIDRMNVGRQPDRKAIIDIVDKLLNIFFPGYYRDRVYKSFNDRSRLSVLVEDAVYNLKKQIEIVLPYAPDYAETDECELAKKAEKIAIAFFNRVPMWLILERAVRLRQHLITVC